MAQGKLCSANPVHGRRPTVIRLVNNTRVEAVEVLQYVLETYKAPNSFSLPQNPEIIINQEQSRNMRRIRTWHRKNSASIASRQSAGDKSHSWFLVFVDEIFWPKDSGINNDGRGEESVEVKQQTPQEMDLFHEPLPVLVKDSTRWAKGQDRQASVYHG
ncbi:hypothetical protein PAAG_04236 [Paracoccidioides lutzii Pb01]|uniref:Uncharacterized protein n=1 Tax=Paracoccidioides lutzii (strain ATCC MYA-826 / Pb01) TaxID=502779 RepID=C1H0E2_PARBA|nr:hypothetical protein PAAG_04236 [Paracoccidioides lutzii Pb01]EEH33183.2 hypothetical protein PAAG_04236 [Paracoccidioides lutzii Pb01]